MDSKIAVSLQRADELLSELKAEYDSSLDEKVVSDRATQLTHEVLERLRSVLDRVARRYWEIHISPALQEEDRRKAHVYFPISDDEHEFDSTLGRWRWKSVRDEHDEIYHFMKKRQPFSDAENLWLRILDELSAKGKHIDLVPQKRTEQKHTTVASGGGAVSWGPGVTFGSGVSVMGAPIDPDTQRIVPTPGVTETVQIWVSFEIEGYDVNALGFCQECVRKTTALISEMIATFNL